MTASGYIHLDVSEIKRVTEKAMLVRVDGEEHWLPLSQVADADDYNEGDVNCTVSITEWIAREKGLMP